MDEVLENLSDGVLTLTINRPKALNAVTCTCCQQLTKAFENAAENYDVRVVVLTAEGRGFCTGQDLAELETSDMGIKERLETCFNPLIKAMDACPKPIIAIINGVAAGAGMSLALACDLRIMADTASFTTAFSKIGLVPDSGMSYTLPKLVGKAKAFELLCLSPKTSASEAMELGLVSEVTNAEELMERGLELAKQFAQGPTKAYSRIKSLLNSEGTLEELLEQETQLQYESTMTEDHKEGMQAFFDKRRPVFKGK